MLTKRLADHLPESDVVGLDASAEMLARADALTTQCLRFESGSIESVAGAWDLIFSNAALQWVGDHHALISHLLSLLRPDGQLIIQVPANDAHVSHTALVDLAKEEPYRMALDGWLRGWSVLPLAAYAELLHAHGGRDLTVFEKVYPHVLDDADAIVEWMQGTALVPYMERLPTDLQQRFVEDYRSRVRKQFPHAPVFYGFRRILFSATQPD